MLVYLPPSRAVPVALVSSCSRLRQSRRSRSRCCCRCCCRQRLRLRRRTSCLASRGCNHEAHLADHELGGRHERFFRLHAHIAARADELTALHRWTSVRSRTIAGLENSRGWYLLAIVVYMHTMPQRRTQLQRLALDLDLTRSSRSRVVCGVSLLSPPKAAP